MNAAPFTIRNARGRTVARFGTYRTAERAAVTRCRDKALAVPVYRHRTHLATVTPGPNARPLIDLTMKGSLIV
ncbi:hypothetical protein C0V97_09115 [Asaia sp. W19]|uniref:hypothetical protein n=1 Tax=unclassified Asaia TaxID=2685023 RepID=UPI000F8E268A|nr:hypothetical protein [Asaia sp. W19]RUT25983.1 hypothetical protein C0V97_09115 [Asaia sp. W19]